MKYIKLIVKSQTKEDHNFQQMLQIHNVHSFENKCNL